MKHGRGDGRKLQILQSAIDLKVSMLLIKKMVKEPLHGKVGTFTMVIT